MSKHTHESRMNRLSKHRFGETMTEGDAREWLGSAHIDWVLASPERLGNAKAGAWTANNAPSYEAYSAIAAAKGVQS